jgi:histidyl-tRNA synthetase
MTIIPSVKGTRDFYPEELARRRWLYERIRAVSESFGYQEYDGPFLERVELYAAKLGEELVKEQSFVFPDRGGDMIALRPELTSSLARMVAARAHTLPTPIRWWSFGPFWRYERPQKGRTREFFQWNIDLLGFDNPETDAEIVAVAAAFFRSLGLGPDRVKILVNSRTLVDTQLSNLGLTAERRPAVLRLIDRRDKMDLESWAAYAAETGLTSNQFDGLQQLLADRGAWNSAPDLVSLFRAAEPLGILEYIAYDPTVIRGLDYYTGLVFEARDQVGEYRAILGGGRYDNLVGDVGGDRVPGTGFAMGDVVIGLVLDEASARPALRVNPADVLVTTFDQLSSSLSLQLCGQLREAGFRVEWFPEGGRLPRQLKYADRQGIPLAAIIGPDEAAAGRVTIKDLRSGVQTDGLLTEAAAIVRIALAGHA